MKTKRFIAAAVLLLTIAFGATVYAAAKPAAAKGLGLGRLTTQRGYDYVTAVLKNKLNMTDKDITSALSSGKTMYQIAAEKGMTLEKFKAALLEEKSKAIDELVKSGALTKEDANSIKEQLKANLDACTGSMCTTNSYASGRGRGMGNGYMRNCILSGNAK